MDIDNLYGRELALAVAEALGWPRLTPEETLGWPRLTPEETLAMADNAEPLPDRFISTCPQIRYYGEKDHVAYTPDRNLYEAMELDRMGMNMSISVAYGKAIARFYGDSYEAMSSAPVVGFADDTEAIATCLCRCWLKMHKLLG